MKPSERMMNQLHIPNHQPLELRELVIAIDSNDQLIQYNPEHMAWLTLTPAAFKRWKKRTPYEKRKERTACVRGVATATGTAKCDIPADVRLPEAQATMHGKSGPVYLRAWGNGEVTFMFNPRDFA